MRAGLRFIPMVPLAILACDGNPRRGWHDDIPPLFVSLPAEASSPEQLEWLQRVPAPPVEFAGMTLEDRNHFQAVVASDSGSLVRVRPVGLVGAGDTLLVWTGISGAAVPAVAEGKGNWLPSRSPSPRFSPGDTLGVVEQLGIWIAEGRIGELESNEIHVGDPATVKLWGDPDSLITGSVEWVHRPFAQTRGPITVGVEFRHARSPEHKGVAALVTVTPSGLTDSVWGAPKQAVVRLSNGWAVFLPRDGRQLEVRFVVTGPTMGDIVVFRDWTQGRVQVVTAGLDMLQRIAEDSLRARSIRN